MSGPHTGSTALVIEVAALKAEVSRLSAALATVESRNKELHAQSDTWQSAAEMREAQLDDLANAHRDQIAALEKDHRRDLIKVGGERDAAERERDKARANALEEAAKVADEHYDEVYRAGMTHAPDSESRDRCFARARSASQIATTVRSLAQLTEKTT